MDRLEPRRYRFAWPEGVGFGDAWDDVHAAGRGLDGAERAAAMELEYDELMRTGMRKAERDEVEQIMAQRAARTATRRERAAKSGPAPSPPTSQCRRAR